jgi:acetyl esterase
MSLLLRFQRSVAKTVLGLPRPLLRGFAGPARRSPEGFELDLQLQGVLRLMVLRNEPEMHEGGVARARRALERSGPLLARPVHDVSGEDRDVPGASTARRARIYRPHETQGLLPALIYFHGGGFALGSIASHDGVCREIASTARIIVVSVDYRLAPEHPFPAGVEDAVAATRWLLADGASLGVDSRALAVGGDSAGGNLAAVVALSLRGEERQPSFQLLFYPAIDFTLSEPSHLYFGKGFLLTAASIAWFKQQYLPSGGLEKDPRASPIFANDLSSLPPALVITAGFDPLRDEGRAYARRLQASGVNVESVCSQGAVHGFMQMTGGVDESARVMGHAARRLREALARPVALSAA